MSEKTELGRRKFLKYAGAAAAVVAVAGAGGAYYYTSLKPPTKLRNSVMLGFGHLNVYVAIEKGFFAEEGLAFENLDVWKGGAEAVTAILTGDCSIGESAALHPFKAKVEGKAPMIICMQGKGGDGNSMILRNDVPANLGQISAVKNLKMGITSRGSSTDLMMRYILSKNGLDPEKDVQIIPIGTGSAQLAALVQNQVDGGNVYEETALELVYKRKTHKFIVDQVTGDGFKEAGVQDLSEYPNVISWTMKSFYESNKDVCRALVRGLAKANKYIHDNPEGTLEVAVKIFPSFEKENLRLSIKRYTSVWNKDISFTKKAFDVLIAIQMFGGGLPKDADKTLKYEEMVTNEFVPR